MSTNNVGCLSEAQKEDIYALWEEGGVTKTHLAAQFDVSTRTIGRVIDSFEEEEEYSNSEEVESELYDPLKLNCKALGYKVGDLFKYKEGIDEYDMTFEPDSILSLSSDDGSILPLFVEEGYPTEMEHYEYLSFVTPCEEVLEDTNETFCEDAEYSIGEAVKVSDPDFSYSGYSVLANIMQLTGFKLGNDPSTLSDFTVIASILHPESAEVVYAIEDFSGNQYMMEGEGLCPMEEITFCEDAEYQFEEYVEVTNLGHVYTNYNALADKLNLKGFKSGEKPTKGGVYVVLAATPHPDTGLIVYVIESLSGEQYMISGYGLSSHKGTEGKYTLIPGSIIVIQYKGEVYTVDASHGSFDAIVNYCSQGWYDSAVNLAQPIKAITEFTKGDVTVSNGHVMYMGDEVNDGLALAILRLMEEGDEGFKKLVAFLGKVKKNPSYKSRMELFGFIKAADIEITDSGDLICWKGIKDDWTDCYSGSIDNSIGAIVTMERTDVNDDSNQTCSAGLHCCAKSYLDSFYGSRVVKVLVNPEDVVSIPTDYNDAKMRTCKYVVIEEVTEL